MPLDQNPLFASPLLRLPDLPLLLACAFSDMTRVAAASGAAAVAAASARAAALAFFALALALAFFASADMSSVGAVDVSSFQPSSYAEKTCRRRRVVVVVARISRRRARRPHPRARAHDDDARTPPTDVRPRQNS